jgi:hypothetical protein
MKSGKKINIKKNFEENQLGFLLWKLESLEDFYPCYKTIIKKQ